MKLQNLLNIISLQFNINLDIVPDFEQSFTIPEKVVSDETYFSEKDFEAHLHKEKDKTAIYYEADSIISLPNNLSKQLI